MSNGTLNFLKWNTRWFLAGIFLVILGYILLGWTSGRRSYEEIVFSWHKLTLAPVILLLGYALIGISLMIKAEK